MNDDTLATVDFHLSWMRDGVCHAQTLHAERVNLWRDHIAEGLRRQFYGAAAGDRLAAEFEAGTLVPSWDERRVHRVRWRDVDTHFSGGIPFRPREGRFYPQGVLRGIAGVFRQSVSPFRCIGVGEEGLAADLNQPLAGVDLGWSAKILDVRPKFEERGGTSMDWFEAVAAGAGMQERAFGRGTDFFAANGFLREDDAGDDGFYRTPRMVHHVDLTAAAFLQALYGRLLGGRRRVLDLMASWVSHLPDDLDPERVDGLGMNREELSANPRLHGFTVHDLNRNPVLPYGDGKMDAVICSLSVEYLTRPLEVFDQVRRVLAPGGVFAVTFSDRWFPTKAIRLWPELHPFERMGYVLELFHRTGGFGGLSTSAIQGYPRPEGDKYASQRAASDPVFAVWGTRS